jgi:hypothetical protein
MKPARVIPGNYSVFKKLLCVMSMVILMNNSFGQGRVLINEYLSWPANSCSVASEYIELYNFGPGAIDIGCYILTDGDYSITIPPGSIILPGQFFVIAGQNSLPLGCANANATVAVNLNWNTCNCTSAPIPTTGDGFMTDGGSGSEQLVLFDASFKMVDAIVRNLSETASPITSSSIGGQCVSRSFDLDTMNIKYEMVGESQGRSNSFARRTDGGCGWLKDPQQSGGATNNTPGSNSALDASLSISTPLTCTNTGGASISVNSGNYVDIFPMRYILARDIDSNAVYNFSDSYIYGIDSSANTVAMNNLVPGIYKMVVETSSGCDLTSFNFNILGCNSAVLNISFTSFELTTVKSKKVRFAWDVGQRNEVGSFVVQRSTDGIRFADYATLTNISDPKFSAGFFFETDLPVRNEYYRIQVQTKSGLLAFTSVKNILVTDVIASTSLHPNPFTDNITVTIPAAQSETIRIFIYDAFGKIVGNQQAIITNGNNHVSVPTKSLKPGIYVIRCEHVNSGLTVTRRVVKTQ